jgi:hypothetical protein
MNIITIASIIIQTYRIFDARRVATSIKFWGKPGVGVIKLFLLRFSAESSILELSKSPKPGPILFYFFSALSNI